MDYLFKLKIFTSILCYMLKKIMKAKNIYVKEIISRHEAAKIRHFDNNKKMSA